MVFVVKITLISTLIVSFQTSSPVDLSHFLNEPYSGNLLHPPFCQK